MNYCVYGGPDFEHLRDVTAATDDEAVREHVTDEVRAIYRDDDEIGSRVTVWHRER